MNWYGLCNLTVSQSNREIPQNRLGAQITGPTDGKGHLTSDDEALIWTAVLGEENIGYILVVFPKNRPPFVGQVTIKPDLRRNGIAEQLYATVDQYLQQNNLQPLRPSRDLSPGSKGLWDKRMREGRR